MATTSPTPIGAASMSKAPQLPTLGRTVSRPLPANNQSHGSGERRWQQRYLEDSSSDIELPVPRLSALRHSDKLSSQAPTRAASPPRKRVVRLSSTPPNAHQMQPLRRSGSKSRAPAARTLSRCKVGERDKDGLSNREDSAADQPSNAGNDKPQASDVKTPVQNPRVVRIVLGSSGSKNGSRLDSSGPASAQSHVDRSGIQVGPPERKALAPLSNNTPLRPAPPPPSKKVSESTAHAKPRVVTVKVNGRFYTKHNCIGRGGSAKVYRVTDEHGALFALKRVSLQNVDELTIRGYKGEIDLLTRLSHVDRVIKLYDYEMNTAKHVLSLVMEMGELDLSKIMSPTHDTKSSRHHERRRFDSADVRFWWKEMLECVQSVHQYDVVHSDLKPVNFVLVQGRLKIIDFGIANAIETDQTVNVHRENQIGTPNYMSPESLTDSNNPSGRSGRSASQPKLMKLGKPSDVWSLGCILYQMVYGLPPFGHLPNQMARCQAIIDWDHRIEFPANGVGGVPVRPEILRTMQRCLNREQHMRPTCEELLDETDPFLYPVTMSDKILPMDEKLLATIIQSVVARCRDKMPSEAEVLSVWPKSYWAMIKKILAAQKTRP